MKGCVRIALGENLLEETRKKLEDWSKGCFFSQIEFGACEVATPAGFDC